MASVPTTRPTPSLGAGRRRYGEDLIRGVLFLAALISVIATVGIVISLVSETISFFREVPFADFITGREWGPLFSDPTFGVLPLVWGTLMVSAIAVVVAIPLGLGTAVYLSEYAPQRVRRVLKPIIELLAGVPTIVFGYFALTFFAPVVLEGLLGIELQAFNALAAGIVTGFLILPIIATLAEDALSAVPSALREGAYGLGSSKLQVSTRVVFPAALSGVVAGIVLGASRAIGETMIATVAAGQTASLLLDPSTPHQTMTGFIAATAKGDVPTGSIGYRTLFAVAALLFVITLLLNAVSIRFVRRFRQVYE